MLYLTYTERNRRMDVKYHHKSCSDHSVNVRVDTELNTSQHCTPVGTKAKGIPVVLGGVWPAGRASRQLYLLPYEQER